VVKRIAVETDVPGAVTVDLDAGSTEKFLDEYLRSLWAHNGLEEF